MVVIRNATAFESRRLADIGIAAWEEAIAAWGEDMDMLRENAERAYRDFTTKSWAAIIVAEIDGEMAGWGAREKADNHITDIWVLPRFWGQGAGSALLDALEGQVRKAGFDTVKLDTHARNARAIGLYKHHGYHVTSLSVKYSAALDHDIEKVDMAKELT